MRYSMNAVRALAAGLLAGAGLLALAAPVAAQEDGATRVVIRAIARDAKIIGDGVGGARITVVDARTGAMLAEGVQRGNTGDTERIMSTPERRGMSLYSTEGAARYVAELPLDGPTIVNISAVGPLGFDQAIQTATKRMLLVPGGHIGGDGVVLELHGYIVEILEPKPLAPITGSFPVRARVRMMCGCPLTPGGMWDSDGVEVRARLWSGGDVVSESALEYAGEASTFRGTLTIPASADGDLELEVLASDPETINFGHHVLPVQATVQAGG